MSKKKTTETAAQVNLQKEKIDVQAATLVGTVRDDILGIFKNHGDWKKLPEGKQRDIAHAAEQLAKQVVRKSAEIICRTWISIYPWNASTSHSQGWPENGCHGQ